jgi:FtsP/CotA-like multicopper oxidase with cupredoxin domain
VVAAGGPPGEHRSVHRVLVSLAVAAVTVMLPTIPLLAGCGGHSGRASSPASRHASERGATLREPPVLRSRHGVLRATLPVERRTVPIAGARVRAKVYRNAFPGPTLRVRPGDVLQLQVVNRLGEPTNLHEHGFHVSPVGVSDNVLRTMPSGTANTVRVEVPANLSPGTYWYHAHFHGLSEEQVFSGLAGVIIVDGLADRLPPPLRRVPEHLLALKDVQIRRGAIVDRNIDSGAPTTRTVNGQLRPTIRVQRGRTQLLRLANLSADIWYHLRLDGARFHVIGEDANPVGRVWTARRLRLPPGKRYDVLVRWPRAGTYSLRTLRMSTGPAGDNYPARELLTVRVSGPAAPVVPWPRALGPLPHLDHARVERVRHLTFNDQPANNAFVIDGRRFDATRVDQVVRLGATEEWVIRNASRELHPFHMHVNDFQVVSVNGRPYRARGLQDTVVLPIHGAVRVRVRFSDFTGPFVYHCHILNHEDSGMMGLGDVTRTGKGPSRRTLRRLAAMRAAMPAMHHGHAGG